jgi:hypothetical protein
VAVTAVAVVGDVVVDVDVDEVVGTPVDWAAVAAAAAASELEPACSSGANGSRGACNGAAAARGAVVAREACGFVAVWVEV